MPEIQSIYSLINEIYLLLDDGDRRFLTRFNLTPARFYALLHLGDRAGLSFSELSDLMLCDKSNITRLIKGMEASDLVVRRPHETDGRVLRLFLTDKGEHLRQKVLTAHHLYNRNRLSGVTEIQESNLSESLAQLKTTLAANLEAELTTS